VLERGRRIDDQILRKYISAYDFIDKQLPVRVEKPNEELERELLLRVLLEIKSEIAQLREFLLASGSKRYTLNAWREELPSEFRGVGGVEADVEIPESVSEMEKEMIISTLSKTNGNKRKAAKLLGMSERTLYRKIIKYGLRDEE